MWRLKIAEGGSPWLRTNNNHAGRQVWEFDPNLGTPEEIAAIDKAREAYRQNRFKTKHSGDLPMRFQVKLNDYVFNMRFLTLVQRLKIW